jgi:hypothetical protein
MHQLGRRQAFSLKSPSAADSCAADIQRWNFNWQQFYFYDTPLQFDNSTTLSVTCDYDTTSRTSPVLPGYGTSEEMCTMGIYMVPNF